MTIPVELSVDLQAKVKPFENLILAALDEIKNTRKAFSFRSLPKLCTVLGGGMRGKEFTILCGSTGSGKTTLLAQWSMELMQAGVPQLVMSVETGPLDYVKRVLSCFERRNINQINLTNEELANIIRKNREHIVAKAYLGLYEDRMSVDDLVATIRYYHSEHGVQFVFLDNLNFFMEVTRSQDAIVEMDRVVHELVILCKQIDVHVVMVMHPKKTQAGSTRVTSEFDIKGSSLAVQEAHNVILFNRPEASELESGRCLFTDREITVAKCRKNGQFVHQPFLVSCTEGVYYNDKQAPTSAHGGFRK